MIFLKRDYAQFFAATSDEPVKKFGLSTLRIAFANSLSYQTFLLKLVTLLAFKTYNLVISREQSVNS